ncbi:hypothetical protein X975_26926, partial [Stegodyphus mimosarum]
MKDFLSSYNLTLHNTSDAPPTFDRIHAQGWPDLTISSDTAAHLIQDWKVDDETEKSIHQQSQDTAGKYRTTAAASKHQGRSRKLHSRNPKMHSTSLQRKASAEECQKASHTQLVEQRAPHATKEV